MENINTIASSKKPLSKLYKLLSSTDNNIYLPINNWEKDLNINVNIDFWTNICKNTFNMSNNTNIQLIQYKINHRVHITQHKMYKMGFTDSDLCTHCTLHTADNYVHALWQCPPVHQFWQEIITNLSLLLGCSLPLSPSLCLLGDSSEINTSNQNTTSILVALSIAKKTILLNWKNRDQLSISQWLNLLSEYISMEQTSALIRKQTENFDQNLLRLLKSPQLAVI